MTSIFYRVCHSRALTRVCTTFVDSWESCVHDTVGEYTTLLERWIYTIRMFYCSILVHQVMHCMLMWYLLASWVEDFSSDKKGRHGCTLSWEDCPVEYAFIILYVLASRVKYFLDDHRKIRGLWVTKEWYTPVRLLILILSKALSHA